MLSWVIYITAILLLKKNLERMKNWRRRYKNYSFLRNKHKETLCRCVISIPFFFHHNLYVQKQRVEVTYTCILSFTVNLCECVVPVVSLNFSSSVCLDFVAGFWCQGSISGSHNQSHSYYFDYLCVTLSLPNFLYVEHCLTLCNYLSIWLSNFMFLCLEVCLKSFLPEGLSDGMSVISFWWHVCQKVCQTQPCIVILVSTDKKTNQFKNLS